ncbi:hypothetical protein PCCS19_48740 [Paenibacillus sp. CCS19]|nr:hypothetical protein PCCS19_48740 [Paenibacillus cellulosilyticus]
METLEARSAARKQHALTKAVPRQGHATPSTQQSHTLLSLATIPSEVQELETAEARGAVRRNTLEQKLCPDRGTRL